MPETITCPDGARITCAIADIADIMRNPSEFLWWSSIGIPLLAAVASTAVAIASVVIAWKARDMAVKSERARVDAEAKRVKIEQQRRLDSSIRDLFIGVADLMNAIAAKQQAHRDAVMAFHKTGVPPALIQPASSSGVRALIAASRLEASNAHELEMLDAVERQVLATDDEDPKDRLADLTRVWEFVVEWRHSNTQNRAQLLEQHRPDRHKPRPPRKGAAVPK